MMIEFEELKEYQKDFKKLLKRYRSLKEDIVVVKKVLKIRPDAHPPFSFRIEGLGLSTPVIKIKKIACKSLKGKGVNSGLRLVYAWFEDERRIIFVELYHKNDKENEDRERIINHFI